MQIIIESIFYSLKILIFLFYQRLQYDMMIYIRIYALFLFLFFTLISEKELDYYNYNFCLCYGSV